MSVIVFSKDKSDYARAVTEFLRDFEHRTSVALETVDPDSTRGAELVRLYDIVEYPAIIATTNDGQIRQFWRGIPLPTIDEVSYYVQ